MDLAIPQITASHVFLGNEFIRSLIKKYKRCPELTYGDPEKISTILHDLGYDQQSVYDILNSNENNDENILPCNPQVSSVQNSWQENMSDLPTGQTDQHLKQSDQSEGQNEKLEVCGLNSTLLISDYITIFNMLKSLAQLDISRTNDKIYKRLSYFVRHHVDQFTTHEPWAYKRYSNNFKRYFKPGMYLLNKRAKKIINRLFSINKMANM